MGIISILPNGGTANIGSTVLCNVYGAPYETITSDGAELCILDSNGAGTATFEIGKTYALVGEVSKYGREVTIRVGTTDIRVMPNGALFWYLNECSDITGGWTGYAGATYSSTSSSGQVPQISDSSNMKTIQQSSTGQFIIGGSYGTVNNLNLANINKIYVKYSATRSNNNCEIKLVVSEDLSNMHNVGFNRSVISVYGTDQSIAELDVSSIDASLLFGIVLEPTGFDGNCSIDISEIWFE